MEPEYVDLRATLPSGGSVKITIPMEIVAEIWRKSERRLSESNVGSFWTSVERFLICFIRSDEKLILELPENVIVSKEYPKELRKRVQEDMFKYQTRKLKENLENLYNDLISGRITKSTFENGVERILANLKTISKEHERLFGERELHFIACGNLEHILASASIESEREKEEAFLSLMEETANLKQNITKTRDLVQSVEQVLKQKNADKEYFVVVKELYLGRLKQAEKRLDRLKELVCNT